ncbi:MAG: ankyrin repeat domain-containing protein [Magnetococcales bacterium]|nr:ankyrin repeat domain-containing protein [Magnetococcales bacterium]
MAKHLSALFFIVCISLSATGYAEKKDLEKYLLNNIKTTMIDVNATGSRGSTLLHWAAKNGYPTIVQYLIEKGADTTRFDNYGTTPIQAAIDGMTPNTGKIVHLLQEAIAKKKRQKKSQSGSDSPGQMDGDTTADDSTSFDSSSSSNSGKSTAEILKAKDLEIKLLRKKIAKLKKSPNRLGSRKSSKNKNSKLVKSLRNELEETKAKLSTVTKENSQLKKQVSSLNIFDYYKIEYMFKTEKLGK